MIRAAENEAAIRKLIDIFVAGWNALTARNSPPLLPKTLISPPLRGFAPAVAILSRVAITRFFPRFTAEPGIPEPSRAFTICAQMSRHLM